MCEMALVYLPPTIARVCHGGNTYVAVAASSDIYVHTKFRENPFIVFQVDILTDRQALSYLHTCDRCFARHKRKHNNVTESRIYFCFHHYTTTPLCPYTLE
jgi:hypothetical protein